LLGEWDVCKYNDLSELYESQITTGQSRRVDLKSFDQIDGNFLTRCSWKILNRNVCVKFSQPRNSCFSTRTADILFSEEKLNMGVSKGQSDNYEDGIPEFLNLGVSLVRDQR